MDRISEEPGADTMSHDELREGATRIGRHPPISNCYPQPLYFQENKPTDESWYYFRVEFPATDGAPVKNTFTASQVSTASEFKKRLLAVAPGAMFSGTAQHLDRMMERRLYNIKRVETIDFIGYSKDYGAYIFGDLAVKDGAIYRANEERLFRPRQPGDQVPGHVRSAHQQRPARLRRGLVSAPVGGLRPERRYCLGVLVRIPVCRTDPADIPGLSFWRSSATRGPARRRSSNSAKLFRRDHEGFDPAKAAPAARARNTAKVFGHACRADRIRPRAHGRGCRRT